MENNQSSKEKNFTGTKSYSINVKKLAKIDKRLSLENIIVELETYNVNNDTSPVNSGSHSELKSLTDSVSVSASHENDNNHIKMIQNSKQVQDVSKTRNNKKQLIKNDQKIKENTQQKRTGCTKNKRKSIKSETNSDEKFVSVSNLDDNNSGCGIVPIDYSLEQNVSSDISPPQKFKQGDTVRENIDEYEVIRLPETSTKLSEMTYTVGRKTEKSGRVRIPRCRLSRFKSGIPISSRKIVHVIYSNENNMNYASKSTNAEQLTHDIATSTSVTVMNTQLVPNVLSMVPENNITLSNSFNRSEKIWPTERKYFICSVITILFTMFMAMIGFMSYRKGTLFAQGTYGELNRDETGLSRHDSNVWLKFL